MLEDTNILAVEDASPPLVREARGGCGALRLLGRLGILAIVVAAVQMAAARARLDRIPSLRVMQFDRTCRIADVVLLGDSTARTLASDRKGTRATPDYLQEYLPGHRVGSAAGAAYQGEVFEAFVQRLVQAPRRPQVVAIVVNPRSFSIEWSRRPGYQHREMEYCLATGPLIYRALVEPLAVFKAVNFAPISEQEFLRTPVCDGDTPIGSVAEMETLPDTVSLTPQDRRNWIVYLYGYRLRPDHPYLLALQRSARLLRNARVTPLFFITPIDHQTATSWYGPDFRSRFSANMAVVRQSLAEAGCELIDMSFDLPADRFHYDRLPNEHTAEAGRRHVARRLAESIRNLGVLNPPRAPRTRRGAPTTHPSPRPSRPHN